MYQHLLLHGERVNVPIHNISYQLAVGRLDSQLVENRSVEDVTCVLVENRTVQDVTCCVLMVAELMVTTILRLHRVVLCLQSEIEICDYDRVLFTLPHRSEIAYIPLIFNIPRNVTNLFHNVHLVSSSDHN